MQDATTHIGVLYTQLFISHAQSLKDKRMVIKRLKDKVRQKYNVSVSELDCEDKWQTALMGYIMIGNDRRYIDGCLQNLLSFVQAYHAAEVVEHDVEFF